MLGEFLVMKNIISEDQLSKALKEQKSLGKMLGETLVHLGILDTDQLDEILQEHLVHRTDEILGELSE